MSRRSIIQILEGSEETRTILANRNGQEIEVQIQGITINFCFPSGRWDHGNIILFYEPDEGLFGWHFSTPYSGKKTQVSRTKEHLNFFLDNLYLYLTSTKMVFFKLFPPLVIVFKEFSERYATLEEARQQLILTLENQLEEIEFCCFDKWYRKISFRQHVNRKFFYKDKQSFFGGDSIGKITEIRYDDCQWQIKLEGANNRQVTLLLNNDYQILEAFGDDWYWVH